MTRPLSTETKIGIPLAVVGALVVWVLTEVKELGQRIAKIEGRLEVSVAYVAPVVPVLPDFQRIHAAPAPASLSMIPHGKRQQ